MIKRFIIISIVAALAIAAASASAKMPSPIQGTLVPETIRAKVGRTVSLTLELLTSKKFKAVELSVKLTDGVSLVEGKPVEQISNFAPGEKKKFVYRVRVQKAGEQRVTFSAKAKELGPHEAYGNVFIAVVNPKPVVDNSVTMTDSDGVKAVVTTGTEPK